jgi:hypothetical protein
MVLLSVEHSHEFSVLPVPEGESPPEEYVLQQRMMTPVFRRRRQLKKAERLARALVELDDCARERRRGLPRRTLRASLSGAR